MSFWDEELYGDDNRENNSVSRDKEVQIFNVGFEWDERKNEINMKKHGISFDVAAYVFF